MSAYNLDESMSRDGISSVLDAAAINGSGSGAEPEGILQTSGIGDVAGGENGLAPSWIHCVRLLKALAVDNVSEGNLGWLTNPLVRAAMMETLATTTATDSKSVWDKIFGDKSLPGQWGITNLVPSDLDKGTSTGVCSAIICGDFTNLVLGLWGQAADVVVDPFTLATSGQTRIIVTVLADGGIRRAEAFAAMKDALTA